MDSCVGSFHSRVAMDRVREEMQFIRDEIDGFERFEERVERLSCVSQAQSGTPMGGGVLTAPSSASPAQKLKHTYQSTVMAVPHYEAEYDEPYAEHVRNELGPDAAALLTSGGVFERHHKQVVIAAANDARSRRSQLLSALDRERESLTELSEQVCAVATDVARLESADFDAEPSVLDGYQSRVGVLEARCHDLIDRRQSTLVSQRRSMSLSLGGPDVATCVYSDLDVDYPVVATLTDLLERLTDLDEALTRVLVR